MYIFGLNLVILHPIGPFDSLELLGGLRCSMIVDIAVISLTDISFSTDLKKCHYLNKMGDNFPSGISF